MGQSFNRLLGHHYQAQLLCPHQHEPRNPQPEESPEDGGQPLLTPAQVQEVAEAEEGGKSPLDKYRYQDDRDAEVEEEGKKGGHVCPDDPVEKGDEGLTQEVAEVQDGGEGPPDGRKDPADQGDEAATKGGKRPPNVPNGLEVEGDEDQVAQESHLPHPAPPPGAAQELCDTRYILAERPRPPPGRILLLHGLGRLDLGLEQLGEAVVDRLVQGFVHRRLPLWADEVVSAAWAGVVARGSVNGKSCCMRLSSWR